MPSDFKFADSAFRTRKRSRRRRQGPQLTARTFPFPFFRLACRAACRTQHQRAARGWIKAASDLLGSKSIEQIVAIAAQDALRDPDPLWPEIAGCGGKTSPATFVVAMISAHGEKLMVLGCDEDVPSFATTTTRSLGTPTAKTEAAATLELLVPVQGLPAATYGLHTMQVLASEDKPTVTFIDTLGVRLCLAKVLLETMDGLGAALRVARDLTSQLEKVVDGDTTSLQVIADASHALRPWLRLQLKATGLALGHEQVEFELRVVALHHLTLHVLPAVLLIAEDLRELTARRGAEALAALDAETHAARMSACVRTQKALDPLISPFVGEGASEDDDGGGERALPSAEVVLAGERLFCALLDLSQLEGQAGRHKEASTAAMRAAEIISSQRLPGLSPPTPIREMSMGFFIHGHFTSRVKRCKDVADRLAELGLAHAARRVLVAAKGWQRGSAASNQAVPSPPAGPGRPASEPPLQVPRWQAAADSPYYGDDPVWAATNKAAEHVDVDWTIGRREFQGGRWLAALPNMEMVLVQINARGPPRGTVVKDSMLRMWLSSSRGLYVAGGGNGSLPGSLTLRQLKGLMERAARSDDAVRRSLKSSDPSELTGVVEFYYEFIATLEAAVGTKNTALLYPLSSMNHSLLQTGRFAEAAAAVRRRLELFELPESAASELDKAAMHGYLAQALLKQGEELEAARMLEREMEMKEPVLGPHHVEVVAGALAVAKALVNAGVEPEVGVYALERAINAASGYDPANPRQAFADELYADSCGLKRIIEPLPHKLVEIEVELGTQRLRAGHVKEALEGFAQGLRRYKELLASQPENAARHPQWQVTQVVARCAVLGTSLARSYEAANDSAETVRRDVADIGVKNCFNFLTSVQMEGEQLQVDA